MKIQLGLGVFSAGMAVLSLARGGVSDVRARTPVLPAWSISSIALTASTPLLGSLGLILTQALATEPAGLSIAGMSNVSRIAVFITLALLLGGAVLAIMSLARRERPGLLPALSLAVNALLIGLFMHFEFDALGFDQDRWAPR